MLLVATQVAALSLVFEARAGQPKELPADTGTGLTLRAGGPAKVERWERIESLVVLGGDATIRGTVTDALVVVGGHAAVDGHVLGDLVVVGGTLTLGAGARIERDVALVRSRLNRVPGAVIAGRVRTADLRWPGWPLGLFLWAAMSLAAVAAGLLVLGVARETLVGASQTIATDPGGAVLGALALWVGAPVLAIIAFLTVVGFPIALAILIFALPSLWFLGYVVVGATIGGWIGQVLAPSVRGWPPWASVVSGMALLQTVALAPLVGPLLVLLAGHLGAGALLRRAWKQRALTTTPPSATQPDRDAATPDLHPPQGAAQPLRLPPTRGGPAFTRKA